MNFRQEVFRLAKLKCSSLSKTFLSKNALIAPEGYALTSAFTLTLFWMAPAEGCNDNSTRYLIHHAEVFSGPLCSRFFYCQASELIFIWRTEISQVWPRTQLYFIRKLENAPFNQRNCQVCPSRSKVPGLRSKISKANHDCVSYFLFVKIPDWHIFFWEVCCKTRVV